ncbi:MAG: hypothetical protein M1828_005165 [Chrysothrix sp. TS-e1954]|nr:MAG: hypothetical protein M1828_005165 [Chrysothrix sp. TS-e1954]
MSAISFLSLPREIRDLIYGYCLDITQPFEFARPGTAKPDCQIGYQGGGYHSRKPERNWNLSTVSKTIHAEVSQHVFDEMSLVIYYEYIDKGCLGNSAAYRHHSQALYPRFRNFTFHFRILQAELLDKMLFPSAISEHVELLQSRSDIKSLRVWIWSDWNSEASHDASRAARVTVEDPRWNQSSTDPFATGSKNGLRLQNGLRLLDFRERFRHAEAIMRQDIKPLDDSRLLDSKEKVRHAGAPVSGFSESIFIRYAENAQPRVGRSWPLEICPVP